MTDKKFKLVGSRVLIEPIKKKNNTDHGVLLPEDVKHGTTRGTIIGVGPGSDTDGMELSIGDTVAFDTRKGVTIKDGDTNNEFIIMNQDDIMLVILPNGEYGVIGNNVLVEPTKQKEQTAMGVLRPSDNLKMNKGKILTVGAKVEKSEIPVGEFAVFGKFAGTEVKDSKTGRDFMLLDKNSIFLIVADDYKDEPVDNISYTDGI